MTQTLTDVRMSDPRQYFRFEEKFIRDHFVVEFGGMQSLDDDVLIPIYRLEHLEVDVIIVQKRRKKCGCDGEKDGVLRREVVRRYT